MSSVYIAVPTNAVKKYCQKEFYGNLVKCVKASKKADSVFVSVADNTSKPGDIYDNSQVLEVNKIFKDGGLEKYNVQHLKIDRDWPNNDPKAVAKLFSKNLNTTIVNSIRDYLRSGYDYFVSLESDVTPQENFIDKLIEDCEQVEKSGLKMYGVGGIYYRQDNIHRSAWFVNPRKFLKCTPNDPSTINLLIWGIAIFPKSFMQFMEDQGYWEAMLHTYKVKPGMFVDGMCNKRMKDHRIARFIDTGIKCGHLHDKNKQRGLDKLK